VDDSEAVVGPVIVMLVVFTPQTETLDDPGVTDPDAA